MWRICSSRDSNSFRDKQGILQAVCLIRFATEPYSPKQIKALAFVVISVAKVISCTIVMINSIHNFVVTLLWWEISVFMVWLKLFMSQCFQQKNINTFDVLTLIKVFTDKKKIKMSAHTKKSSRCNKKFVSRLMKNKFSIGGLIGVHISNIVNEVIRTISSLLIFFTKIFWTQKMYQNAKQTIFTLLEVFVYAKIVVFVL